MMATLHFSSSSLWEKLWHTNFLKKAVLPTLVLTEQANTLASFQADFLLSAQALLYVTVIMYNQFNLQQQGFAKQVTLGSIMYHKAILNCSAVHEVIRVYFENVLCSIAQHILITTKLPVWKYFVRKIFL